MSIAQLNAAKVYSYINAKLNVRKSYFLRVMDYERLLECSIKELLSYLNSKPFYKERIDQNELITATDYFQIEKIFKQLGYLELENLSKRLPEESSSFIKFYFQKDYISSLKGVLGGLDAKKTDPSQILNLVFTPKGQHSKIESSLKSSTDLKAFINNLSESWEKKSLIDSFDLYKKTKRIIYLQQALDLSYYEILLQKCKKLKKYDQDIISKFIRLEIDLYNLEVIFRTFGYSKEEKLIQMIWVPSKYLKYDELIPLNANSKIFKVLEKTKYRNLSKSLEERSLEDSKLVALDMVIQEYFIQSTFRIQDPFNLGVFFSYSVLRFQELNNLIYLIKGMKMKMDINSIRSKMIYY